MEDELISLKIAILAKENGFDVPCVNAFDKLDMPCTDLQGGLNKINYNSSGYMKSRPTQTNLLKWFRECNILIFALPVSDNNKFWYWWVGHLDDNGSIYDSSETYYEYNNTTYEQAIESAFEFGFKVLNNQ